MTDAERDAIIADARANLRRLQALRRCLAATAGHDIAAYVELLDIDSSITAAERALTHPD